MLSYIKAEDLRLAGIRTDEIHQNTDGGGFSCPVRPQVAKNLAGNDFDADSGDPQPAAVVL